MKPHLLILCDPFTPPAYTPRLRCWCDYLTKQGWRIDVYTEQGEPLTFSHHYPIHEVCIYRTHSTIEWAVKSVCSLLFDWRNRAFSHRVRSAIAGKRYDAVVCCTFSTFPLRAALDIARERHLPLHVDLRDIDEQAPNAQYQNHRQWWARPFRAWYSHTNIRRRNQVLRQADAITCVSPWHKQFLSAFNSNVSLIYNGYDAAIFSPHDQQVDEFTIAYVGRIYEHPMQDPTLLFEALQTMDINLHICWYTNSAGKQRIRHLAKQYGVERFMRYFDYVPPAQVPAILHSASILLVLSNNAVDSGAHGIMTTKFYEALGVEKPVLCIRSDEECLAQVIHDTNAGLAATTADQVKAFILSAYHEWQQNGFTHRQVDQDRKRMFSRQYQAQQLETLLLTIIRPRTATYD